MSDVPTTRASLIIRVKNHQDHDAWSQFTEIYTPLVYRYARKRGLQDADAADIAQEVLGSVARAIPEFQYDRSKGLFRSWLYTVARNKVLNHLSRKKNYAIGSGNTQVKQMIEQQPAPDAEVEQQWNLDYHRRVFVYVADQVKPNFRANTWEAFWQTSVDNKPAKDVAESLGLTVGAVYIAKSRVLEKFRLAIHELADDGDTLLGISDS